MSYYFVGSLQRYFRSFFAGARLRLLGALAVGSVILGVSTSAWAVGPPYYEDFESEQACGTGCGAVCVLGPSGWLNAAGDDLDFSTDSGGTSSSSTGPTTDHNPGTASGNYLYVEASCSGTGYPTKTANLISPPLQLQSVLTPAAYFWYHQLRGSCTSTSWTQAKPC